MILIMQDILYHGEFVIATELFILCLVNVELKKFNRDCRAEWSFKRMVWLLVCKAT